MKDIFNLMESVCSIHKLPFDAFCNHKGCQKAICSSCKKEHEGHTLLKEDEYAQMIKEKMQSTVTNLKADIAKAIIAKQQIEGASLDIIKSQVADLLMVYKDIENRVHMYLGHHENKMKKIQGQKAILIKAVDTDIITLESKAKEIEDTMKNMDAKADFTKISEATEKIKIIPQSKTIAEKEVEKMLQKINHYKSTPVFNQIKQISQRTVEKMRLAILTEGIHSVI